MTVVSQRGWVAFALQSGRLGGECVPTGSDFYFHRASMVDFGPQDMTDTLPQEVGGGLFPVYTYKNGAFSAGAISVEMRLKKNIGYLLSACSGSVATASATGASATKHTFSPGVTDHTSMKWLSLYRYVPAAAGYNGVTEGHADCRLPQMNLVVPQMGPARAEFTFVGRVPSIATGESAVTKNFEDGSTLGLSHSGSVAFTAAVLNDTSFSTLTTGATFIGGVVNIVNNFTTPQQEMIIGDVYPDDLAVLGRTATITLTYKWRDPALYRAIRNNTTNYFSKVVQYSAVSLKTRSVANIATNYGPYELEFYAPYVAWQSTTPRLAPGEMLTIDLIGTIHDPADGSNAPWQLNLINGEAGATYM